MSDIDNGNSPSGRPANDQHPAADPHDPAVLPPEAGRIADLETELGEARDRLLRALAETENVRRRGEREREETARFAISRFAGDILSVADNLRRALESVPGQALEGNEFLTKLVDGVVATERELLAVFEKHGLKRLDPTGRPFDPNFHEVLFEMDAPGKPPGTVVQVLQPGYTIGERLLRPARVAVAKAAPDVGRVDTQA
ncbi:MAG TPA: nucleotide exchange factor GrpE [Alphaproteobacteria bacterium]|nr:nucleotide exchange factor GrpE [Alphaproteobacteria bacterium]